MKLLHNVPAITKAIIVAGLLGACQTEKEAVVNPITEQAEKADYQNAKLSPSYKVNRLLSDDYVTLQYTGPYRKLFKQINESVKEYTEFNHTYANQISSTKYNSSTQTVLEKTVYVLNTEGKCTQSHHKINGASGTEVYIYEYNSDGRVKKSYKESNPKYYEEFVYSTVNGKINLQSIKYYNGDTKYKEQTFIYHYMQEDKAKINPACIALGRGKYLPIFGSFNEHLVKEIKETSFGNQGVATSTIYREFSYSYSEDIETVKEKNNYGVLSTKRKYGVL
jgi:hypothetical protein